MILKSHHATWAEYDLLVRSGLLENSPSKVELIRGEIVEMNPSGPVHDDYVLYLTNWSSDSRDKQRTHITSQTGVDMPEIDSRPEPDVFWVRRARYRDGHPKAQDVQLAIEVADSSLSKDFEIKRRMYAEVGIVEYWIVDCQNRSVHVLRDPQGDDYRSHQIFTSKDVISPLIEPNAILNLSDLFDGN